MEWHNVTSPKEYERIGPVILLEHSSEIQGGSNMTGTDLYVNKPHCTAAVRP